MRKEIVWPICLAFILAAVMYSQRRLKDMAEDPSQMGLLPFSEEEPGEVREGEEGAESASSPDENGDGSSEHLNGGMEAGDESAAAGGSAGPTPISDPVLARETVQRALKEANVAFQKREALAAASPEELHQTPELIRYAADQLGRVVELEAQYPGLKASFVEFYLSCARDEKSITVIRAQCLEKYMVQPSLSEKEKEDVLHELPETVVRLFRAL